MEKEEKMVPTVIGGFPGIMAAGSAIANAKMVRNLIIVAGSVLLVGVALAFILG